MIQPHDLIATVSILERNINDIWTPTVITSWDIHFCETFNDRFNDGYRPIPLTEKILTEWCKESFELDEDMGDIIHYKLIGTRFLIVFNHNDISLNYETTDGYYCLKYWNLGIPLHHLQRLILSLTNEPLKITLK